MGFIAGFQEILRNQGYQQPDKQGVNESCLLTTR
jgi:hypothetical protein